MTRMGLIAFDGPGGATLRLTDAGRAEYHLRTTPVVPQRWVAILNHMERTNDRAL